MDKWDERFMQLAETVAGWSSCYQENRHVGAVVVKDKRILHTFVISSISLLIVAFAVFTIAGYFNTEPLSFFKDATYTGQTYLTGDYSIPLIIASVFQVLNHLYMTYYLFEIAYAKRLQLLDCSENCTVSDVFYAFLSKNKE